MDKVTAVLVFLVVLWSILLFIIGGWQVLLAAWVGAIIGMLLGFGILALLGRL